MVWVATRVLAAQDAPDAAVPEEQAPPAIPANSLSGIQLAQDADTLVSPSDVAKPNAPQLPAAAPEVADDSPEQTARDEPTNDAPTAPNFGAQGEVVFGTGLAGSMRGYNATEAVSRDVRAWTNVDYFFVQNLSLGFAVTLSSSLARGYGADGSLVETRASLISGGVRLGANLPLGSRWSLYFSSTLGFHHSEQRQRLLAGKTISIANSPTGADSIPRTGPWLELYVPLLVQLAPHFLVGFGPRLYHNFARAPRRDGPAAEVTSLGGALTVLGYWGGPPDQATAFVRERETAARFGAQGVWVITGALHLSANWSRYSGSDSGTSNFAIGPAAAWFASEDVALGAQLTFSRSSLSGYAGSHRATYDVMSAGVFGSVAQNFWLGESISWFPSLGLGVRLDDWDARSDGARNNHKTTSVWIGVSAPLLLHVATHFFLGLGPSLSHDLSQSGPLENLSTELGIESVAGGWL